MATAARVKTFFAVVGPLAAGTAYANSRSWKAAARAREQELLAEQGKVTKLEADLKKEQEKMLTLLECADRQDRLALIEKKLEEGTGLSNDMGIFMTGVVSLSALGILALTGRR